MTGYMLKKRLRASGGSVNEQFHVSASHPDSDEGSVLIQAELSTRDQEATGRRFCCHDLTPAEVDTLIKLLRKARRASRSLHRRYWADIRKSERAA